MNYCGLDLCDVLNGSGFRVTLFVSGCNHFCKGCHNEKTWDYNYGKYFSNDVKNIIYNELKKDYIDGITITGGDPLNEKNYEEVYQLVSYINKNFPNKSIWIYTGYTWEDIIYDNNRLRIIEMCNVLVDGKFDIDKRDVSLKFRGSSNQRLIDIQQSLQLNYPIILSE